MRQRQRKLVCVSSRRRLTPRGAKAARPSSAHSAPVATASIRCRPTRTARSAATATVAPRRPSSARPAELLKVLHGVFGQFDLDPCAPRRSRNRVKAWIHLTHEDNGLLVAWHGTVFVNPPYGRGLAAWVTKARREVEEGHARVVVALLPAPGWTCVKRTWIRARSFSSKTSLPIEKTRPCPSAA